MNIRFFHGNQLPFCKHDMVEPERSVDGVA